MPLSKLQGVSIEIPLHGILEGVGALEELLTLLLSNRSLRGIEVFIKELPEVIGHVQNLEIASKPKKVFSVTKSLLICQNDLLESRLHLLGDIAEVFLFLQDFTDESLLAFKVIVVKLLVNLLEHGDPLDHVHGIEVISIRSRPNIERSNKSYGPFDTNYDPNAFLVYFFWIAMPTRLNDCAFP